MRIFYIDTKERTIINNYLKDKELFFLALVDKYKLTIQYNSNNIKGSYKDLLSTLLRKIPNEKLETLFKYLTDGSKEYILQRLNQQKDPFQFFRTEIVKTHEPEKALAFLYLRDYL